MPFGEGFDEIYGLFIAGAITEAGFDPVRADDIRNQQNILKDVIAGIAESSLVVADLTGSNANVYYELGIAHGFKKRVILVTQSIDELPFDLKSYRVIPYSTHFADIGKARSALVSIASDALAGRIVFGSPVTDFLSNPSRSVEPAKVIERVTESDIGEAGVLDYLVNLEDGFDSLSQIVNGITAEMASMTEISTTTGQRLTLLCHLLRGGFR